MPYSRVLFRMTLSDLANYSITRTRRRLLCDSLASCTAWLAYKDDPDEFEISCEICEVAWEKYSRHFPVRYFLPPCDFVRRFPVLHFSSPTRSVAYKAVSGFAVGLLVARLKAKYAMVTVVGPSSVLWSYLEN